MKEISKQGWIYVLWNPLFPKFVKIGRAADVGQRMKSLNTAVPIRFELVAKFRTKNAAKTESEIHGIIHCVQNPKCDSHEFFKLKRDDAARLAAHFAYASGDPDSYLSYSSGKCYDIVGAPGAEPLPSVPPALRSVVFHTRKQGSNVRMRVTGANGYTVLKGSVFADLTKGLKTTTRPAEVKIRSIRENLLSGGAKNGRLAANHAFASPHVAAAMMLGRQSCNGFIEWVDGNGRPLKSYLDELERSAVRPEPVAED